MSRKSCIGNLYIESTIDCKSYRNEHKKGFLQFIHIRSKILLSSNDKVLL